MARLTRKNLKVFGGSGTSMNFAKFGSQRAAAPVKTMDIELIQSLDAWIHGWTEAVNAANLAPFLEDMNAVMYVMGYQLGYVMQDGIPEWNAATTYYIGSIVKKTGTVELYSSLTDTNLNNALGTQADNTNWKYLGDLKKIIVDGSTLDNDGTTGKLKIKALGVDTAQLAALSVTKTKLNADVAGLGIVIGGGTGALDVNVDDSTLEISSDAVRIKAKGVKTGNIDDLAVGTSQLAAQSVNDTKLAALFAASLNDSGPYVMSGFYTSVMNGASGLQLSPSSNVRIIVMANATITGGTARLYLNLPGASTADSPSIDSASSCNLFFSFNVPAGSRAIFLYAKSVTGSPVVTFTNIMYFVIGTY